MSTHHLEEKRRCSGAHQADGRRDEPRQRQTEPHARRGGGCGARDGCHQPDRAQRGPAPGRQPVPQRVAPVAAAIDRGFARGAARHQVEQRGQGREVPAGVREVFEPAVGAGQLDEDRGDLQPGQARCERASGCHSGDHVAAGPSDPNGQANPPKPAVSAPCASALSRIRPTLRLRSGAPPGRSRPSQQPPSRAQGSQAALIR